MEELKPIKLNVLYGEENRTNKLKAYKAEGEMKRAVSNHKNSIEAFFESKHNLPKTFKVKNLGTTGEEDYSLIELINSKLTNASIQVCLNTYQVYKQCGIEYAIERLHLQSNLDII